MFIIKPETADALNDFFTNIGQKLASEIPKSSKTFETYVNEVKRHIFLAKNIRC